MILDLLFSLALSILGIDIGLASVYGLGEPWSGDVTASGQPVGVGIAHRTIPLGTRVLVCRLDRLRCVKTITFDRGPYGCVPHEGTGWRVAGGRPRRCPHGWRFRGVADLSAPVARELGYRDGLRPVVVVPL